MPEAIHLACTRCGGTWPISALLFGCPTCTAGGHTTALEVRYPDSARLPDASTRRHASIWDFAARLPLDAASSRVSLGEGWTPLFAAPCLGSNAFVKLETVNPSGSFKDRLNSVAVSMAVQLGYRRVLCTSTGNHGISLAAYAAAAGLECLVVCSPGVEPLAVRQIRLHGARAVRADGPPEATRAWLTEMICEQGWWPSVRNHPRPYANPFGLEGYKTIAYEIWHQMDREVPDWVLVPTGGGDSLAGIARGFHELVELGLARRSPRLVACQSAAAAPLVEAVTRGESAVGSVPVRPSVAVSIAEDQTGDHALRALDSTDRAVAVSEVAIGAAVRWLGAGGLCVDPASAAGAAALLEMRASGEMGADETAVWVATGSGVRWSAAMAGADGEPEPISPLATPGAV